MEMPTLSPEDLLKEVIELAVDNGVQNQEEWDNVVAEVMDGHLALAELDSEEDIEEMQEVLCSRWKDYKTGALS